MWTQISLIWNLIRHVSSKAPRRSLPSRALASAMAPGAFPAPYAQLRVGLWSGCPASAARPQPAPFYPRLTLAGPPALFPSPLSTCPPLSALPAAGSAGGGVRAGIAQAGACILPALSSLRSRRPRRRMAHIWFRRARSNFPPSKPGNSVTLSICENRQAKLQK